MLAHLLAHLLAHTPRLTRLPPCRYLEIDDRNGFTLHSDLSDALRGAVELKTLIVRSHGLANMRRVIKHLPVNLERLEVEGMRLSRASIQTGALCVPSVCLVPCVYVPYACV